MPGWVDAFSLGALRVPDPKSINPAIACLHIFGIRGVVNPGVFYEGDILVVNSRVTYNHFVEDKWQPAEIPDEFRPKDA